MRTSGVRYALTDVDAFSDGLFGPTLIEHRTNGFDGDGGSGSLKAVEAFAKRIGFAFTVVEQIGPGDTDLRQLVWLAYSGEAAVGVWTTLDNTWPEDAADLTWRGNSLPPIRPWEAIAHAADAARVKQRIVRCDVDGSPFPECKRWLMQL